jgi:hypothetical protein
MDYTQNMIKQISNIYINMIKYKQPTEFYTSISIENRIIQTGAKLIITDFNMLPTKIEESWVVDFTDNFLIYDRANRYSESEKVKHQKNVGSNIYDIFDFITNNYENLPEIMIFCKGNVIPRHCGIRKFIEISNNTKFTPIENYIRETPPFHDGIYSYVDENDCYFECFTEVNDTVSGRYRSKTFFSYKSLLDEIFENGTHGHYLRFAPGSNYILIKQDVLKYNKHFYETMRDLVSWDVQPGEAYLLERMMFTLFENNFIIKEKYKNDNNKFNG